LQLPNCFDENNKGDERHTSIKKIIASERFSKFSARALHYNRDFFALSSVEKITAAQRVQIVLQARREDIALLRLAPPALGMPCGARYLISYGLGARSTSKTNK
jgi:hypothetical protein